MRVEERFGGNGHRDGDGGMKKERAVCVERPNRLSLGGREEPYSEEGPGADRRGRSAKMRGMALAGGTMGREREARRAAGLSGLRISVR